jgi:hypothetical protein
MGTSGDIASDVIGHAPCPMACNGLRQAWQVWHRGQCGICKLQNGGGGHEFESLRPPLVNRLRIGASRTIFRSISSDIAELCLPLFQLPSQVLVPGALHCSLSWHKAAFLFSKFPLIDCVTALQTSQTTIPVRAGPPAAGTSGSLPRPQASRSYPLPNRAAERQLRTDRDAPSEGAAPRHPQSR